VLPAPVPPPMTHPEPIPTTARDAPRVPDAERPRGTPEDRTAYRLLEQCGRLTRSELEAVAAWWQARREAGQGLCEFLVLAGVFSPGAPETIGLIAKGYLTLDDPSIAFTPAGVDALPAELRGDRPQRASEPRPPLPGEASVTPAGVPATPPEASPPSRPEASQSSLSHASQPSRPGEPAPERQVAPGLGVRLGKCLITGRLGGRREVQLFRAVHTTLGKPVAVKAYVPEGGRRERRRHALHAEAQVLARLDHPSIVKIHDYEARGRYPHLVLELVEGMTLLELVRHCGAVAPRASVRLLYALAQGLAHAAGAGVLHGDVHPSNVLLGRDGRAKLASFGNLPVAGERRWRSSITAGYVAPERVLGQERLDLRSDVYSLGATLFHALTGRAVFEGDEPAALARRHATERPPAPADVVASVPAALSQLVERMMARDPADRPGSYRELLGEIEALVRRRRGGRASSARRSRGTSRGSRSRSRSTGSTSQSSGSRSRSSGSTSRSSGSTSRSSGSTSRSSGRSSRGLGGGRGSRRRRR